MRDPISALQGASFEGIARVEDAGVTGMITLRGNFNDAAFGKALKAATGLHLPGQREVTTADGRAVLWMSPDELLVICRYSEADDLTADLAAKLGSQHALAINVSDARARISVSGANAREVLAKLMPVDFSAAAFPAGRIRRSRLAQIPAAVWSAETGRFEVLMFRSVAQYAFDALCAAAQQGSEVGLTA